MASLLYIPEDEEKKIIIGERNHKSKFLYLPQFCLCPFHPYYCLELYTSFFLITYAGAIQRGAIFLKM